MSIDDFIKIIPDDEHDLLKSSGGMIDNWKVCDDDVDRLGYLIVKWHGTVRFKREYESNKFHKMIKGFNAECIDGIGGITINERLYAFWLFEIFDTRNDKSMIYKKLKAAQQGDAPEPASPAR